MTAVVSPVRPRRVRELVVSRVVDQAALGLGSLVLARHFGPVAFAPAAGLFVWNSLAVQLSDHGIGFAVLRSAPGTVLDRSALARLRRVNGLAVLAAVVVAVAWPPAAPWLLAGAAMWALSAEGYVRRAATLKRDRPHHAARAELLAAGAFAAVVVAVLVADVDVAWVGAAFVVRHVVEVGALGPVGAVFADGGARVTSGAEWVGQVMTYVAGNVDYLVVAAWFSAADLSVYVIAYRFAAVVVALLSVPMTQQAFVDLAASGQARPATHDAVVRRALAVGVVAVVAVFGVAAVAPVALGDGWGDVGRLAAVLGLAAPWRMLLGIVVAAAVTGGRARSLVWWEAARAAAIGAAVAVGATSGLGGAAVGVTAATIATITAEHLGTSHGGSAGLRRALVASAAAAVALAAVLAVAL